MDLFVLNDETKKNSHGFFLLNEGGQFERFNENPVMLHNHDVEQLVGKWLNLHRSGSRLLAEPQFDEGDELALKIKGKVERGYLRGASPGIIILSAEWRQTPETGENDIYVTRWELCEGSTVPIPSNAGAISLKVYDTNRQAVSDADVRSHVENIIRLGLGKQEIKTKTHEKMNEIKLTAVAFVVLGLKEDADGAAISAAIVKLHADKEKAEKELETARKQAETDLQKRCTDMVDLAISEGRITADKKEAFVNLALADYDTAKATLDSIPAKVNLSQRVTPIAGASDIPADRKGWTLLQWMKQDMAGLNKLKEESPTAYEEIKKNK